MQVAVLEQNKASTKVSTKYFNFADVFLEEKVLILPEQNNLNKHTIELESDKQQSYEPIYIQGLIELEILKTYIEIYLKTGFI